MTRKGFIEYIAVKYNTASSYVEPWVDAVLNSIIECANKEDKLMFKNFGTFDRVKYSARDGLPDRYILKFKFGKLFNTSLTTEEYNMLSSEIDEECNDAPE